MQLSEYRSYMISELLKKINTNTDNDTAVFCQAPIDTDRTINYQYHGSTKEHTQRRAEPVTAKDCAYFLTRTVWSTVSKAADRSITTSTVTCPVSAGSNMFMVFYSSVVSVENITNRFYIHTYG